MRKLQLIQNLLQLKYNKDIIATIFPNASSSIQLHLANKLGNENLKQSKKNVATLSSLISFGMTLDSENLLTFENYFNEL